MLGKENIKISDVSRVINIGSKNLGIICSSAKKGGRLNFAYEVEENGGSSGKLIDGAEPYHNIYSNNSPAVWKLPSDPNFKVYNRLLYDENNHYCFKLGSFREYNHKAMGNGLLYFKTVEQINTLTRSKTIKVPAQVLLGDIDWSKITNEKGNVRADLIRVEIDRSITGDAPYKSPYIKLTGQRTVDFGDVFLEIDISEIRSYKYPTKLVLYSYENVKCGELLGLGYIEINVIPEPIRAELYVDVEGIKSVYALDGEVSVNRDTISGEFVYRMVVDPSPDKISKSLYKIDYLRINRETSQIVETKTITYGFTQYESPKTIYKERSIITADVSRIITNANEFVRVIMYYK